MLLTNVAGLSLPSLTVRNSTSIAAFASAVAAELYSKLALEHPGALLSLFPISWEQSRDDISVSTSGCIELGSSSFLGY